MHNHHMIEHHRHNLNNAEPLERKARAQILAGNKVKATMYQHRGEPLEGLQARAELMARNYRGKVVMHEV